MTTTNQQNQTITKRIAHHWPQMKITDNTLYDIHATFKPEVTEVMKELGSCVWEAIWDCKRSKTLTTEAYIRNVQKHIKKYPRIAASSFDANVEKIDQYGNPWADWMDGDSISNKKKHLQLPGEKPRQGTSNTFFLPLPDNEPGREMLLKDKGISDNQLAIIEQLTYIQDAAKVVGIKKFELERGFSINDILRQFTDEELKRLESLGNQQVEGALISRNEWASIIRYLKSDKEISNLILSDMLMQDETPLALTFHKKGDSKNAIVAFKGTTGALEWIDNVLGMILSDTDSQLKAYNFIEGLKYSNITVTGHSKGGNKAMYVAIRSDKVTRAVAYDGQGFSQEFLNEYSKEIQSKAKNIKNYSLSTDFVNILMFPIPGAELIWVKGYGVDSLGENHSPNSLFVTEGKWDKKEQSISDAIGKSPMELTLGEEFLGMFDKYTDFIPNMAGPKYKLGELVLDENGKPKMDEIPQDDSLRMLHELINFIMNTADPNDKKKIAVYISKLAGMIFNKEDKPSKFDIAKYVVSDLNTLAAIIAYLIKYMDTYEIGSEDIRELLNSLGVNMDDKFIYDIPILGEIDAASAVTNSLKNNLTDEKRDFFIEKVLGNFDLPHNFIESFFGPVITGVYEKIAPSTDFLGDFWRTVEGKVIEIGDVDSKKAIQNGQLSDKVVPNISYNVKLEDEFSKEQSSEASGKQEQSEELEQEIVKELPVRLRTRIVLNEDKVFQSLYNRLVYKLQEDMSASSAGVYQ